MGSSTKGYENAEDLIRQSMGEQRASAGRAEDFYRQGIAGFSPYSQAGVGGLSEFQRALMESQDPTAYLKKLMGSYQESPGLQANIQAGEQAANRAAAASGMIGSGAEMQNAASRAQALRSQDLQNYLNQALGLRSQYLGGQQGLAGMGMRSAEDILKGYGGMAGTEMNLAQMLGQGYGGLAQSEIGKAAQPGWGSQLAGGLGALGGYFLGGPAGGMLGGSLGGSLGRGLFG